MDARGKIHRMASIARVVLVATCVSVALGAQAPWVLQVTGRVVDTSGESRPGVRVCASPLEQRPRFRTECSTSGANGAFTVRPRVPGQYRILADDLANGHVSQGRLFFRAPALPSVEVLLTETSPSAEVEVVLAPKNPELFVTAIDAETSWPLEPLHVTLCHVWNRSECLVAEERNDGGGAVRIMAPHVPFTVVVASPFHELWLGVSGSDPFEPIVIESGRSRDLAVRLRRKADWRGKPISDREKTPGLYLAAPLQLSPPDGAVLSVLPRATKVEWRAVDGAASYRVDLDYCEGRSAAPGCVHPRPLRWQKPAMSGITSTSYEFSFIGAQPGRWRVVAIDRDGREGFWSPWRVFVHTR
jgi:hypothetical protein